MVRRLGVAGAVLTVTAALALAACGGGGDSSVSTNTTPTTATTVPSTTTTKPPVTTTKPATPKPPETTAPPKPTVSVVPAPPTPAPTTTPPTVAPTTVPPSTAPPPTTTTPDQAKAAALERKLLARKELGPSNRGVPDDLRFVVTYTPGKKLLVTWAINNGTGPAPTGTPTCTSPPTTPASTTSTAVSGVATPATTLPPSTTVAPTRSTSEEARYEAREILLTVRSQLAPLKLTISGLQLVGTYPIDSHGESDVVQVLYSKSTVKSGFADYTRAFEVPPAEAVQCLDPAFK